MIDRVYLMFYASAIVNQFLETFKEFPPRQEPASFTITNAVEELEKFLASSGG
jgi:arylsulfatase